MPLVMTWLGSGVAPAAFDAGIRGCVQMNSQAHMLLRGRGDPAAQRRGRTDDRRAASVESDVTCTGRI